ncbi:MAG: hypothetical protein AAF628_03645 [Planctomycetota bacterium]
MKKQFKELLHHYKVEAFKISHHHDDSAQKSAAEILAFTREALNNEYHYHFHTDPDPKRIETFKMINHFVLEALLPPVLEKVMWRVMSLERTHEELVKLVGDILETLSDDNLRLDP